MKIQTRNTNDYLKKQAETTLCILYKNWIIFHNHLKSHFKSIQFHQYFHYTRQLAN